MGGRQPSLQHPRHILLGAQARTGVLPVCDHYSGAPARMQKSLVLQAELLRCGLPRLLHYHRAFLPRLALAALQAAD